MDAAEYELMDAVEEEMWWYRALHARVLDALLRRPGPPGRPVLDAGCGTGGLLRRLAACPGLDRTLIGVEYFPPAAARARAKSGAPVAAGDLNALPFPEGGFGAVTSLDVLGHQAVDHARALAELRRVLAPGGTLVLNLPAFEWMKSAHDIRVHNARRFTARDVASMLEEAGFARIEARYWNALLFPVMVAQRKLLVTGAEAASDVAPFPPWLDRILHGVTALERQLSGFGLRYPAGGSVLAVASRQ